MKYQTPIVVFLAVACLSTSADARMYQWRHPQSGSIQLSGTAPSWYRDGGSGPRVFVFDNGQLIDDTAISVGESQRALLREQALGLSSVSPAVAPSDAANDEEKLRDALENAAREGVDVNALASEAVNAAREETSETPATVADTVAELKALLKTWDDIRASEARTVLEEQQTELP